MISTVTLSQFGLFKGLPESILKELAAMSTETQISKGEYVFREGEKADKLHFLINGTIALRVQLTSRPEKVTVSFVASPYQSFGWSGVVAPHHYTSSAECEEESNILSMPADAFMQLMEQNPAAGFKVMQRVAELIADRLRNSHQALLKTI